MWESSTELVSLRSLSPAGMNHQKYVVKSYPAARCLLSSSSFSRWTHLSISFYNFLFLTSAYRTWRSLLSFSTLHEHRFRLFSPSEPSFLKNLQIRATIQFKLFIYDFTYVGVDHWIGFVAIVIACRDEPPKIWSYIVPCSLSLSSLNTFMVHVACL